MSVHQVPAPRSRPALTLIDSHTPRPAPPHRTSPTLSLALLGTGPPLPFRPHLSASAPIRRVAHLDL